MHSPDDDRLRVAFDDLRARETTRTPSFRRVWSAAMQRGVTPRRRYALVFAGLFLAAVTSVLLLVPRREPALVAIPAQWRGPTDFLLQTPGNDLLRSVPQLAAPIPDYAQKGR